MPRREGMEPTVSLLISEHSSQQSFFDYCIRKISGLLKSDSARSMGARARLFVQGSPPRESCFSLAQPHCARKRTPFSGEPCSEQKGKPRRIHRVTGSVLDPQQNQNNMAIAKGAVER